MNGTLMSSPLIFSPSDHSTRTVSPSDNLTAELFGPNVSLSKETRLEFYPRKERRLTLMWMAGYVTDPVNFK